MESLVDVTHDAPDVSMKVIDGAAFVNMNRPKSSTTYGKYCEDELLSKLKFTSQNTKKLDLVFDVYNENSLKSQTRENRGGGMRISVLKDTLICKDFQKFRRNDTNKTKLFKMIAEAVIQILETLATIVATIGSKIVSNSSLEKLNIEPCNHEEADTRLLLHVLDGANSGIKKVSIIAVDTDVVVIALQHFFTLNLEELCIEFGVDKYRRYILIHTCPETFGRKLCSSSTLWHAFTGCDTVSSFNRKVKKTAWKVL